VPEENLGDPEGNDSDNGNDDDNFGNDLDNGLTAGASELDELDWDEAEFEREFGGVFGEPGCGRDLLRYGAMVHEADIRLTGDGPVLVAIELVGERR
jgi:hypothetical protein